MILADLSFRLRALLRRRQVERELNDELVFHLEHEAERYMRDGVPPDEAMRRARAAFGGVERIKDDTRDVRGLSMLDTLLQDLRYAWRGLRSRPGFTLGLVLTLALGIGANAAMFGIVDRMLFRAPAYLTASDRTHRVQMDYMWDGRERSDDAFAYTRLLDVVRRTTSFETVAGFAHRRMAIGTGGDTRDVTVDAVTASYFGLFDARPVIGRFFTPAEDTASNAAQVVVLGNAYWRGMGAPADIVGRTLHIGPGLLTVIGVAPEGFTGTTDGDTPAAFMPMSTLVAQRGATFFDSYNWSWLHIMVRRSEGVSVAAANTELTAALQKSWNREADRAGYPDAASARVRGVVTPVLESRGPRADASSKIVAWVMGVAVIVLLVACANVANLLLARAVTRKREVALRLALGVTRRRLVQQLLTESLLIAALGGAAGVLVAHWSAGSLRALFLSREVSSPVVTDPRTLLFAGIITLVVAVLTGIAPALHALREDVAGALKSGAREGSGSPARSRLSGMLLLLQAAFSVLLLVGAGLFIRSLHNVRTIRMGYDVEPVILAQVNRRGVVLGETEQNALAQRLVEAARELPGIVSVTPSESVPFYSFEGRGAPVIPGRDSLERLGSFTLQVGNEDYFRTTGTRILRGRGIAADDREGTVPVMIVSESMARALWPDREAVGETLRIGDLPVDFTVVGVAEDVRASGLHEGGGEFWYYVPATQYVKHFGAVGLQIYARVNGNAADFAEPLRRRLQREVPGIAYVGTLPLADIITPELRAWSLGATMFTAFGALALLLAAIGLYSSIAYAVAQRTHELGVRIALGAGAGDVIRLVVRQGIAFAAAGIAAGTVAAALAARWVEPLLFNESAHDPLVYAVVVLVLLAVAVAATLRPAWHASHVDPTRALRAD